MVLLNDGERKTLGGVPNNDVPNNDTQLPGLGRARLARELFSGRYRPGQSLQLDKVAAEHGMDHDSALRAFAEFQALGLITLAGDSSAIVHSPNPKEMPEAYEIRAALEEIGGRAAARALKGNTAALQRELDAMRSAFRDRDLDSFVEHDVRFHRSILPSCPTPEVRLRSEQLGCRSANSRS